MGLRGRVREWEFVTAKIDPTIVVAIEQEWRVFYYQYQHDIEVLVLQYYRFIEISIITR